MKRIGIVGGVSWQSTVEYYAGLCRLSERRAAKNRRGGPLTPEMCIESLDHRTAVALLGRDEDPESWRRFDEYHRTALKRLQAGDAEVAVIASNTPHHRFASITRGIAIPVLSIVDASAREAASIGAKRALVLGTAITMGSKMYPETFRHYGIEAASPTAKKTCAAVIAIIKELEHGRIEGAGRRIHAIADDALGGRVPDGTVVCLACTELPLAFPSRSEEPSFEQDGVSYLNSAAAHIHALFDFATA